MLQVEMQDGNKTETYYAKEGARHDLLLQSTGVE